MKLLIAILLLTLVLPSVSSNIVFASGKEPVGGIDRNYYFRIELSQWSITAYDMNQIEDLMLQGVSRDRAMKQSLYHGRIGSLTKGSHVFLEIYSFDVQHGFSAKDFDIAISIIKPKSNDEYNKPTLIDFYLPDDDVSISAFCHIYCGLGHSDMKLKFVIGEGDPEIGSYIFIGFIAINLFIFIIVIRSILKTRLVKGISKL